MYLCEINISDSEHWGFRNCRRSGLLSHFSFLNISLVLQLKAISHLQDVPVPKHFGEKGKTKESYLAGMCKQQIDRMWRIILPETTVREKNSYTQSYQGVRMDGPFSMTQKENNSCCHSYWLLWSHWGQIITLNLHYVNLTLSLVKKQASPTEQQWKNKSWMTAKGMLTKNESLWNKKEVATILTCYIWMNVNEIKLWEQAESSWEQDFQREITFRSVLHLNQKTWKVVLAALMVFLSCLVRLKNMWPLQSKFCL